MKDLLKTPLSPIVLKYIARISAFNNLWETSKETTKDFSDGLRKTTIITSAGASTRIEGAMLSDEQIIKRLEELQIQKIRDRDEAEVAGYIDALNYIFEHAKDLEISEHTIRSLHQMMCNYLPTDALAPNQRGAYKNISNSVMRIDEKTGQREVIFETTPPGIQTETQMKELVSDYNAFCRDPNYSDLEVITAFVVKFLAIHPFRDGNGRLARLLTNLCLIQQGYQFCMYTSHEKVIEDNKDAYYLALRQTQASLSTSADLNPWLIFFLKVLDEQTRHLEGKLIPKKLGRTTILEDKVIRIIHSHQPVSIGFLQRTSDIKRVTLKSILARLKKKGIIQMEGTRKGSVYRMKIEA